MTIGRVCLFCVFVCSLTLVRWDCLDLPGSRCLCPWTEALHLSRRSEPDEWTWMQHMRWYQWEPTRSPQRSKCAIASDCQWIPCWSLAPTNSQSQLARRCLALLSTPQLSQGLWIVGLWLREASDPSSSCQSQWKRGPFGWRDWR